MQKTIALVTIWICAAAIAIFNREAAGYAIFAAFLTSVIVI